MAWTGACGTLRDTGEVSPSQGAGLTGTTPLPGGSTGGDRPSVERLRFADFARQRADGVIVTGFREDDIAARWSRLHPEDLAIRTGFYTLDIAGRTIHRLEIDKRYDRFLHQPFVAADPTGAWVLRQGFRRIPHHRSSVIGRLVAALPGKRAGSPHPDLRDDGRDRFLLTYDLWDLGNRRRVRDLEVFWLEIADAAEAERWRRASAMLARLDRPFYQHRPKDPARPPGQPFDAFFKALDQAFQRLCWLRLSAWERSGDALWLVHRDGLRRIGVDGRVSPLLRVRPSPTREDRMREGFWSLPLSEIVEHETHFLVRNPYCLLHVPKDAVFREAAEVWLSEAELGLTVLDETADRPLTLRQTGFLSAHLVSLAELSEAAARSALATLAGEVAARFVALIGGSEGEPTFELAFRTGETILTEAELFALALERGWDLRQATRALLTAWLDAVKRHELGGRGQTAIAGGIDPDTNHWFHGLGQALRYLVATGPDSLDLLRLYLTRRDGEREIFAADVLSRMYLERYGYSSQDSYRFAIFWVATRSSDGPDPADDLWTDLGLLDAAAASMAPAAFADLVLDELGAFADERTDRPVGAILDALKRVLRGRADPAGASGDRWRAELLTELGRRAADG